MHLFYQTSPQLEVAMLCCHLWCWKSLSIQSPELAGCCCGHGDVFKSCLDRPHEAAQLCRHNYLMSVWCVWDQTLHMKEHTVLIMFFFLKTCTEIHMGRKNLPRGGVVICQLTVDRSISSLLLLRRSLSYLRKLHASSGERQWSTQVGRLKMEQRLGSRAVGPPPLIITILWICSGYSWARKVQNDTLWQWEQRAGYRTGWNNQSDCAVSFVLITFEPE